tara:strand:- start:1434 stop:1943 length:510 start_codon:yes stop_codon:yes gene_type:complete
MAKLTAKQKELLNNITQELRRETALAYISMGYENQTKAYLAACEKMGKNPSKNPETSASEILSYPNVLGFIASVKEQVAQEVQIDAAWVLKSLKKVHDRCMQEEAVKDRDGAPTGEYKFEHSGANKALELIGRHTDVQAYKDRTEVRNINEDLSDEELEKRIAALQASK